MLLMADPHPEHSGGATEPRKTGPRPEGCVQTCKSVRLACLSSEHEYPASRPTACPLRVPLRVLRRASRPWRPLKIRRGRAEIWFSASGQAAHETGGRKILERFSECGDQNETTHPICAEHWNALTAGSFSVHNGRPVSGRLLNRGERETLVGRSASGPDNRILTCHSPYALYVCRPDLASTGFCPLASPH